MVHLTRLFMRATSPPPSCEAGTGGRAKGEVEGGMRPGPRLMPALARTVARSIAFGNDGFGISGMVRHHGSEEHDKQGCSQAAAWLGNHNRDALAARGDGCASGSAMVGQSRSACIGGTRQWLQVHQAAASFGIHNRHALAASLFDVNLARSLVLAGVAHAPLRFAPLHFVLFLGAKMALGLTLLRKRSGLLRKRSGFLRKRSGLLHSKSRLKTR